MDEAGTCIRVRPRFAGDKIFRSRSLTRRKSRSADMLGRCTSIVYCWALFQAVWLLCPLNVCTKHCTNFTTATEIDGQLSLVQPQNPSQSVCSTTDSAYLIAPARVSDIQRPRTNHWLVVTLCITSGCVLLFKRCP